jgi:ABC-type branched-subunit amino acid transport system ATPase component
MLLLEIKDIDTFYGPSHVLFDVSLNVVRGGAVGLLGRNGAGKSTTMKGVIGLAPPTEGEILYRGQNIVGLSPIKYAGLASDMSLRNEGYFGANGDGKPGDLSSQSTLGHERVVGT